MDLRKTGGKTTLFLLALVMLSANADQQDVQEEPAMHVRQVRSATDMTTSTSSPNAATTPVAGDNDSRSQSTCRLPACGAACPPGPAGPPGRDGRDGRDAVPSCTGSTATPITYPTTSGPSPTTTTPNTPTVSTLYTRWGHTSCSGSAQFVYKGITAGSHFSHKGNGANFLCLPEVPIYGTVNTGTTSRGHIFSTEYQTGNFGNYGNVHNHSPPCAVCLKEGKSSVLMIPARNVCPSSAWNLEYKGYLMSALDSESKTEYICVDENMETISGTSANVNGATIFPVVGRCLTGGGIPCGPYVNGYELTCAVCTI